MSDVDNKVKMIVEGLLMAAGRPLSLDNITAVFSEDEKPDRKELKDVMEAIRLDCDDRGFELVEVASGFRFQVKQDISDWVAKLWEEKPPRYTRALLETLALIAYRQPITRGDIEEIRGVAVSSNITRTLLDREWIRIVGHRDVPGRPAMFATTKQFLDYFNLKSLEELPPLSEIKELDKQEEKLDLNAELAKQRVIDLPEESVDENSLELSEEEKAEMLAEEEAIELAKKPLDEILSQDPARQQAEAEEDGQEDDGQEDDDHQEGDDQGESVQAGQDDAEVLAVDTGDSDLDEVSQPGESEDFDAAEQGEALALDEEAFPHDDADVSAGPDQAGADEVEQGQDDGDEFVELAGGDEAEADADEAQTEPAIAFEAEAADDDEAIEETDETIDFTATDAEEDAAAADETANDSETIRDENEVEDEGPPADAGHDDRSGGN
ncbi:MAG: SMC-Scp complex subunit ScpB [Pseudomonadales bacterium]|nr:SMC-Scp complex subunit ScpB [Pseudomonadales bacterium]